MPDGVSVPFDASLRAVIAAQRLGRDNLRELAEACPVLSLLAFTLCHLHGTQNVVTVGVESSNA
jgi:hypothetical protein